MFKNILFAVLFSIVCCISKAQTGFQKTYSSINNLESRTACKTKDNGYMLLGINVWAVGTSGDITDIQAIKTDSNGAIMWAKIYTAINNEQPIAVLETDDSGYVIAGINSNGSDDDILVLKIDDTGKILWQKVIGGVRDERAYGIEQTDDEGYIITGSSSDPLTSGTSIYLIKMDSIGNLQWTRCYESNDAWSSETGRFVTQTADRNYFIVGQQGNDILTLKTDSTGNVLWIKHHTGLIIPAIEHVKKTSDGGAILVGHSFYSTTTPNSMMAKIDSLGNVEWAKEYDSNEELIAMCVSGDLESGYILTGGSPSTCILVAKTNVQGDIQWCRRMCGSGFMYASYVDELSNGDCTFFGYRTELPSSVYMRRFFLFKTDSMGRSLCQMDTLAINSIGHTTVTSSPILTTFTNDTIHTYNLTIKSTLGEETLVCGKISKVQEVNHNRTQVYPSPVESTAHFQSEIEMSKIDIFNLIGIQVKSEKLDSKEAYIDVRDLPNSVYLYVVHTRLSASTGKFTKCN